MTGRIRNDIVQYDALCPHRRDTSTFGSELQTNRKVVNKTIQVKTFDDDKDFKKPLLVRQDGANIYLQKAGSVPSLSMLLLTTTGSKRSLAGLTSSPGRQTCRVNDEQKVGDFVKPALLRRSGSLFMSDLLKTIPLENDSNDCDNYATDNEETKEDDGKIHHSSLNNILMAVIQISETN
jgi:hypothetical protein